MVRITTVVPSSDTVALPPKRAYAAGSDAAALPVDVEDGAVVDVLVDALVHMLESSAVAARSGNVSSEARGMTGSIPAVAPRTRDTLADYR